MKHKNSKVVPPPLSPGPTSPNTLPFLGISPYMSLSSSYATVISVQFELCQSNSIAVTLDCWTSIHVNSYLGVTVHFFNENLMFFCLTLAIKHLHEQHYMRFSRNRVF